MKNLLVALADENYIEQAKQLFSSVYWNAGWKGDYMLLAHEIPEEELKWFSDKSILIKRCKPLYKEIEGLQWVGWDKFYLFTPEFKKWKNIIFLDLDIIVRASLDDLTKIKGFAAVHDNIKSNLSKQFTAFEEKNKNSFIELQKYYNLKATAFNVGVIAFSTDIIKKDVFAKLKELYEIYQGIITNREQSVLNLLFYKRWIKLPQVYNLLASFEIRNYNIKPEKVKAIILHFAGSKPWDSKKDYFYKEWKRNLERAELIDLNKTQIPKIWTNKEIKKYSFYFKKRSAIIRLDGYIGLIGLFLKNNFPKLYFMLKKLKNEKRFICNADG